jgi:MerR family transcriptional regulator, copper efflux regulator
MLIGELSKRSGFSRDTIRYYERLSLLTVKHRDTENQYKNYGPEAVDRLRQIRQLKDIGFTLHEIRQLLAGQDDRHPCEGLPLQLAQKVDKIDGQIATLLNFKASLVAMKSACNGECATPGGVPECVPVTGAARPQSSRCC